MPWIEALRPSDRLARLTAGARPKQPGHAYRIRNLGQDEAEVLLYDEIGWYGTTAEDFVRELRDVQTRRLAVRVNSPGGGVFDGIAIANAIRSHPADTTVHVDGMAASIASVIAMAGDRVIMQPHSQLMIHDASGLAIGNAQDMEEMRDLLDRQSDNIAQVYADRAGGSVEDWRAAMKRETWYSAQEAVAAGLADEMAPSRRHADEPCEEPDDPDESGEPDDQARLAARWDLSVFRYAGRDAAPAPRPVAAKPGPPPSRPMAEPRHRDTVLSASIGTAIGEQLVAAIRAAVTPATEPAEDAPAVADPPAEEPSATAADPVEPSGEEPQAPAPEPVTPEPAAEQPATEAPPEPVPEPHPRADEWTSAVAHLTQPADADDWTALTRHLTQPSSAATTA